MLWKDNVIKKVGDYHGKAMRGEAMKKSAREIINKAITEYVYPYGSASATIDRNVAISNIATSLRELILARLPKDNMLPLDLKYCDMEIHRKPTDLTPLLNEIRNQTLADARRVVEEVFKT